ncbi:O-antigen translocase [Flavobacterium sp.]|uniref:O-antigen translocase n=1 Tax=Flavobacterium sp. TaxID=239 RepID=UPI00374FDF24
MRLIKTSFFSAIITIIKIASGFIANKAVAIFAGTAGIAVVGAFTNFLSISLVFANGAINTGVIKYAAEIDEEVQQKKLFSTALKITVYCSIFIGILLLLFAPFWSRLIFTKNLYPGPIRALGLAIVFYAINVLLVSILNGLGQIKTYTIVNAIGSIVALIMTVLLVYFYQIQGALYALVLSQAIVFFVTLAILLKEKWIGFSYFNQKFDIETAKKLSHYSLMAVVSAMTVPLSQIVIRNHLIANFGIDLTGCWQGVVRISDAYLMLITTSLATYFLPKLSSLKTNVELRKEILKGYKLIIPFVFMGCSFIYFFRAFIISILFTPEFKTMENYFFWQLIGDFFKMASWILAYIMLAKAMTKMYIITEILFTLIYITLGFYLTSIFQLQGIVMAYAINYFLYFIFMIVLFRKLLFKNNEIT